MKMFPWSAMLTQSEPKVPGRRTSEELVINTLMLELGAMVKRTERIHLERASECRRRRRRSSSSSNSASTVDYSWLTTVPNPQPYELTPNDLVELQALCGKIPPAQCGPVIVRFRNLVSHMEPEVSEVPRLFGSVLRECVDEIIRSEETAQDGVAERQQRSKSLSFDTFRSKFSTGYLYKGGSTRGSKGNLQQQVHWSDDEDVVDEGAIKVRVRNKRSMSMPEITPMEQCSPR